MARERVGKKDLAQMVKAQEFWLDFTESGQFLNKQELFQGGLAVSVHNS